MSAPQAKSGVATTPPYVGGRRVPHNFDGESFKLSANENPLGASEKVSAALKNIGAPSLYPDGHASDLRATLAARFDITADNIVCGNGSGDVLALLAQAYVGEGDEVLHTQHAFLLYNIVARGAGGTPVAVAETELTADVDALLAAVTPATKMVFLANPNNPTGTMIFEDELTRLHEGLRDDILLVLDGAYAEYVDPQNLPNDFGLVEENQNVVAVRTFSKAYGLAALRLGWAYCPPAVADVLNRLRGPFNVNQWAQRAGIAAIADRAHIETSRTHNVQWRDWLRQQLGGLGLSVRPSCANFVLLEFADGREAQAAETFLCGRGVIPRGLTAYGLPHALRLSVGTEAANRAALDALTDFFNESRR